MKRILLIICAALSCSAALAKKAADPVTVPASDSRITVIGRSVTADDGSVVLNWSATTLCVKFDGSNLSLRAQDSHINYYNVWIDREPSAESDLVFETTQVDSIYTVADKLKKGEHVVYIQKRTEGRLGNTVFKAFSCDGEFLQARGLKARMFEVIGDSLTAAYGSEGLDYKEKYKPETQNPAKSYVQILARYFDADVFQLGHSGMGIARNTGDKMPGIYMEHLYPLAIDVKEHPEYAGAAEEAAWNPSKSDFAPALTIIFLGANDFANGKQPSYASFAKHYIKLMKMVKENYGEDHKILCVAYQRDAYIYRYIVDSVRESGLTNVYCMAESRGVMSSDSKDLGSVSHPNYNGHMKYAYTLIPYVATLTGWDVKPLE